MTNPVRLGVNIDHVATLRNARGGLHPDPVEIAKLALEAGADGITAHLREDRRHIRDIDVQRLKTEVAAPLNLEMAVTEEMLAVALRTKPHAACLVPERREELTTEGGLAVAGHEAELAPFIAQLKHAGIRVSLFVDADAAQLHAAKTVGADIVELHTGKYGYSEGLAQRHELARLQAAAALTEELGLECHAGHGLNYQNTSAVAAIRQVVELNIGHFLMGQALFTGIRETITHMRVLMNAARQ